MTDTLRAELLGIVNPIIDQWAGHVGTTHSTSCYQRHVACLAVLIRELASDDGGGVGMSSTTYSEDERERTDMRGEA